MWIDSGFVQGLESSSINPTQYKSLIPVFQVWHLYGGNIFCSGPNWSCDKWASSACIASMKTPWKCNITWHWLKYFNLAQEHMSDFVMAYSGPTWSNQKHPKGGWQPAFEVCGLSHHWHRVSCHPQANPGQCYGWWSNCLQSAKPQVIIERSESGHSSQRPRGCTGGSFSMLYTPDRNCWGILEVHQTKTYRKRVENLTKKATVKRHGCIDFVCPKSVTSGHWCQFPFCCYIRIFFFKNTLYAWAMHMPPRLLAVTFTCLHHFATLSAWCSQLFYFI